MCGKIAKNLERGVNDRKKIERTMGSEFFLTAFYVNRITSFYSSATEQMILPSPRCGSTSGTVRISLPCDERQIG